MSKLEEERAILERVTKDEIAFDLKFLEELIYKLLELFVEDRIFSSGNRAAIRDRAGSLLPPFVQEISCYLVRQITAHCPSVKSRFEEFNFREPITFGNYFRFLYRVCRFIFGKNKVGWRVLWQHIKETLKTRVKKQS